MTLTGKKFEDLVAIMAKLRSPDGCPWDREQTYRTITPHTLEEAHEVVEAIDREDFPGLCEELGDLLLQVLFYAQMATEEKRFSIDEVIDAISKKLIHRHPHVFGDTKVADSEEVLKQWEHLKQAEGKKSVLGGVPKALPALLKAYRIGEKTSRVGFDWSDAEGILEKVEEETRELYEAREQKDKAAIDHEYGDLLFTLANCGRFLELDPEGSLRRATERFENRFKWMEEEATRQNRTLKSLSPEEWNQLWDEAKQKT
ncbi:MAG: nucleoside triphosphate pyrophosphohydrolase [Deltaproteobacteria bacterium]|nr:nucleoside triphosphate pyrophosphohydrolase [Deltaproteobacteria bacterium]